MMQRKKKRTRRKTKEFTCPTCGYEAYKMARYSHCPLCVVCKGCEKKVKKCCCIEGE